MADKVLVNLATGLEDSERVTIAFLVAGAALERGREVAMFLTKEAVRLELLACPFCVNARRLDADGFVANARVAGGTPMFDWLGDEGGTVFSY